MKKETKDWLNRIGWGLLILVILIFLFKQIPQDTSLHSPGEEISALTGTCYGESVEKFGRPNYAGDPNMQHMSGHPCYVFNQCQKWPPIGFEGNSSELFCCVPLGECVRHIE